LVLPYMTVLGLEYFREKGEPLLDHMLVKRTKNLQLRINSATLIARAIAIATGTISTARPEPHIFATHRAKTNLVVP